MICLLTVTRAVSQCPLNGQESHVPEGTLGVDDEETAESNALLLNQDVVVTGDLLVLVRDQGELEVGAKTTLLAGLGRPGKVREVGVGGNT